MTWDWLLQGLLCHTLLIDGAPRLGLGLDGLLNPLQFDFMRQALLMVVIVAIPTALLSCFLVLKGWALLGDAIAHATLPGVILAWLMGLPYAVGALCAGITCAAASGWLGANSRLKGDTVMGIVFSGMFAIGLLLHTTVRSDVHLGHILLGDVLGTQWADIRQSACIAALLCTAIGLQWRDLLLYTFSPIHAQTLGLRTAWLHHGLLIGVSLAVVACLKAVGLILSIALLIAPGAIAFLLTRTFGTMLLVASAVAVGSGVLGVTLSFYLDSAPAPTVVLVLTAVFISALGFGERRYEKSSPDK